ncbi:redox-sensitive transcriptional activator SoxR [Aquicoccus porphyridii]|uniref:Redox-sensitive transcriptional activator SoxR n=1 Tax=Aquicoccus porphyridii TaxID=1852029 RepID=A0A5A9ZSX8_9RHOB|nr:redox-sensitive transcriptional activator SoxR [Aquicoccus porphyridii]KAA0920394.1 redox-sensitive transcriptional activator SoxR [Aquicoccus porphyridii]RAI54818.1 redox-sensitive transcriptional activator SoxR [Rhodobacteraceae bacterium AsT-22]
MPPSPKDMLPIGHIAKRTGLAVSAIRFYEDKGLIRATRTASGQRRFARADIRRLSFIRIAQGLGLTLPEIAALLSDLPDGRTPTARDWKAISHRIRATLDARIATLEKLRDDLDGCIGCGCLSLDKCRLYNRDDRAAARGSGPRYLMGDSASDPQG